MCYITYLNMRLWLWLCGCTIGIQPGHHMHLVVSVHPSFCPPHPVMPTCEDRAHIRMHEIQIAQEVVKRSRESVELVLGALQPLLLSALAPPGPPLPPPASLRVTSSMARRSMSRRLSMELLMPNWPSALCTSNRTCETKNTVNTHTSPFSAIAIR